MREKAGGCLGQALKWIRWMWAVRQRHRRKEPMDTKKQQILETGLRLFLEKGYPKTSMQDIAVGCNFSKATLYKFFDSKEAIGILAAFYLTEQMKEKTENIMDRQDLRPRELLRESILVRMENFAERTRFTDELILSFTPEQMEKCLPALNRNRFHMFDLFLHVIMRAFELEDEALAAELTINFNGLMREISIVAKDGIVELDEKAAADFIADSLEAILQKRRGKKRLLTGQQLDEIRSAVENEEKQLRPIFQKKRLAAELRSSLEDYEKSGRRAKLEEAERLLAELKALESEEE